MATELRVRSISQDCEMSRSVWMREVFGTLELYVIHEGSWIKTDPRVEEC